VRKVKCMVRRRGRWYWLRANNGRVRQDCSSSWTVEEG